jgi:hypothetical protein
MQTLTTRRRSVLLVAIGALLLAALGTASQAAATTLYACVKKDGTAHIYTKKPKCKKRETKLSWSTDGVAGRNGLNGANGLNGLNGVNGKEGPRGLVGPQGPGASTFTFDAAASATPTRVTLGAVPGGTVFADCFQPGAGLAALRVYLQTSDGSWAIDYTYISDLNGTNSTLTNHLVFPTGSLSEPLTIETLTATAAPYTADRQIDFVQLGPAKGHMIWHERAETTSAPAQNCHFSVQSFPSS